MPKFLSLEKITLSVLALLLAVAGIYSYHLVSLLLPLFTLLFLWRQKKAGYKISIHFYPSFIYLFLLLLLMGASLLWTKAPFPKALHVLMATSLTLFFLIPLLSNLGRSEDNTIDFVYRIMKMAGFLLIFLVLFQNMMDFFSIDSFRTLLKHCMMKPSGSILGLAVFIGCGFLWINNQKILCWATFILMTCVIYLTNCQTAFYGLFFASGVFLLSYLAPFWTTRFSLVSTYTFLLVSPFLFPYLKSLLTTPWVIGHPSFFHRMLGWEFLSEKFLEKPFLGWGLCSTHFIPSQAELAEGYQNVIHAHNSSLQVYLELGLLGGILFALFFSSLFRTVEKHLKDPLSIAVCNATLAFGFVQAEITHSLWHNHWISCVGLITAFLLLFLKARARQLHASTDH